MSFPALELQIFSQVHLTQQLSQSIKSLQKITPIDSTSPQFKATIQQYGQDHLILYKLPLNSQVRQQKYLCFTKSQRISENNDSLYYSQRQQKIYKVDQLKNEIVQVQVSKLSQEISSKINKLNEENEKNIKLLEQKLKLYMKKYYSQPNGLSCHLIIENQKIKQLIIGLCSKNMKISNYFAGQWTSYWSFKQNYLQGNFNIRNHFFQGGNTIFHRNKPFYKQLSNQMKIDLNNMSQKQITSIIQLIEKEQFHFQHDLQRIYNICLTRIFKKIRRISPVTQSRMIWNINSVILSKNLKQSQNTHFKQAL